MCSQMRPLLGGYGHPDGSRRLERRNANRARSIIGTTAAERGKSPSSNHAANALRSKGVNRDHVCPTIATAFEDLRNAAHVGRSPSDFRARRGEAGGRRCRKLYDTSRSPSARRGSIARTPHLKAPSATGCAMPFVPRELRDQWMSTTGPRPCAPSYHAQQTEGHIHDPEPQDAAEGASNSRLHPPNEAAARGENAHGPIRRSHWRSSAAHGNRSSPGLVGGAALFLRCPDRPDAVNTRRLWRREYRRSATQFENPASSGAAPGIASCLFTIGRIKPHQWQGVHQCPWGGAGQRARNIRRCAHGVDNGDRRCQWW